jgi:hypothetical protein
VVIIICISKKDRQYNGKQKKDKQRSTKHTHKSSDRVTRIPLNNYLLNNEWNVFRIILIIQTNIDYVNVADVRQTLYNINKLSFLLTNVTGDTNLKFLLNFYTKL